MSSKSDFQNSDHELQVIPAELLSDVSGGATALVITQYPNGTAMGFGVAGASFGCGVGVFAGGGGFSVSFTCN
jgi:hypothetical protein